MQQGLLISSTTAAGRLCSLRRDKRHPQSLCHDICLGCTSASLPVRSPKLQTAMHCATVPLCGHTPAWCDLMCRLRHNNTTVQPAPPNGVASTARHNSQAAPSPAVQTPQVTVRAMGLLGHQHTYLQTLAGTDKTARLLRPLTFNMLAAPTASHMHHTAPPAQQHQVS